MNAQTATRDLATTAKVGLDPAQLALVAQIIQPMIDQRNLKGHALFADVSRAFGADIAALGVKPLAVIRELERLQLIVSSRDKSDHDTPVWNATSLGAVWQAVYVANQGGVAFARDTLIEDESLVNYARIELRGALDLMVDEGYISMVDGFYTVARSPLFELIERRTGTSGADTV